MKRTAVVLATGILAYRYHQKRLVRNTVQVRQETRRRLIEHLRANGRGLTILDQSFLTNSRVEGPLTILGDGVVVSGSSFSLIEDPFV